ncbi:hypothetical protein F3Y22_tig00112470pilonHSYRG00015 [Hibiscus syriacus]|uniref:Uncharacterized protein n=1 Tax=Hibiscus syriacus TaxID=106335 RepID=A0A6A2XC44_HIBSY|nr:uncharacterized protein LOC120179829 [Hibiscus syriacus]KAE8667020.1 hypothetical protein F3Y22_tig00112470pilonHSYRG00015 [Hibiscus syriacus]
MGTKVGYRGITTIANSRSFCQHFMDDYFKASSKVGVLKIRVTNMDSIKNTMQMHEEMFKHQVRELHRLYNVQKMLMDELKKEIGTNKWGRNGSCSGDHIRAIKTEKGFDLERPVGDEDSEIELTLSIGGGSSKKKVVKNSQSKGYNQSGGEGIREVDSSGSFKSKKGEYFNGPDTSSLTSPWFKHKQPLNIFPKV